MPESIVKHKPGEDLTCHASAAVTGARFVVISGVPVDGNPRVAHAGAGVKTFGVSATDAASGTKFPVHTGPGLIVEVEAGATLTANDTVESNASGQAIVRATGVAAGVVVEGATSGNKALIAFRPQSV